MLRRGSRKMGEMGGALSPQRASFHSFDQQTSIALMQLCARVGVKRSMSQATALKEPNSENCRRLNGINEALKHTAQEANHREKAPAGSSRKTF